MDVFFWLAVGFGLAATFLVLLFLRERAERLYQESSSTAYRNLANNRWAALKVETSRAEDLQVDLADAQALLGDDDAHSILSESDDFIEALVALRLEERVFYEEELEAAMVHIEEVEADLEEAEEDLDEVAEIADSAIEGWRAADARTAKAARDGLVIVNICRRLLDERPDGDFLTFKDLGVQYPNDDECSGCGHPECPAFVRGEGLVKDVHTT